MESGSPFEAKPEVPFFGEMKAPPAPAAPKARFASLASRLRRGRAGDTESGPTSAPKQEVPFLSETKTPIRPLGIGDRAERAPRRPAAAGPVLGDRQSTTDTVPRWRPLSVPIEAERAERPSDPARYALQLAIALAASALLLLVMTAVAAIASDGRVAILETRGLPIFIAGATAIVVFTLLRTSGESPPDFGRDRRSATRGVVGGFVILVALSALVYQPAVAGPLQSRLERVLSVFGAEDAAAVESFQQNVEEWNREAKQYRDLIAGAAKLDLNVFRQRVATSEASLEATLLQMHSAAESAQYPRLQDALDDIAAKFDDELGALRLVSRGFLSNDFALVSAGDARFKDAKRRAVGLFEGRLKPILERAGIDSDAFEQALTG